jgi:aromatic ring-opening dioxygenase catalytic subunit (LigB family)
MGSKDKKVKEILKKLSENDQIKELLPKTVSRKTRDMNLLPMLIILGHLLRDENVYHPALK